MSLVRTVADRMRGFIESRRGNIAMIYGLALVPLALAAGGGLDYARAVVVRNAMSAALDSAALAVGSTPGLTTQQMQTLAQQYFNANYSISDAYGTPAPVSVTPNGQSLIVSTTDPMPTTMLKMVGIQTMSVDAQSKVVWGQLKIWVALALDNTGSMSQSDSTGLSKMSALKTASQQLLTLLQGASSNPGDVRVSIIPFARSVNIGSSYSTASWLSWSDFSAASAAPSQSVGPGSNCPYTNTTSAPYRCVSSPAQNYPSCNVGGSTYTCAATIPSSGTYKGYICPSQTTSGHYFNGCYNSVSLGYGKYSHTWIPNATSTWGNCVTDRGTASGPVSPPDYDTTAATPTSSTANSMMVAENSPSCPATTLMGLSYDWGSLSSEIDGMDANGSTNQTIGLVWAWASLTQGAPLSPPALPSGTNRVIILLSDGLNTQDRWYGNGSDQSSQVDARMALACTNAKAAGITIYAVYVDIAGTQGNSTTLQNCATDGSKYFDLTSSSQIITAFAQIGQQITNLRVSQ